MKPTNMTLEYFTSSWVCNSRTISICDTRRFVNDTGIPRIFEGPVRIISWSFFSNDGIFETCFFKSNLPVIYSLYKERDPFLWSRRINIINNLFFRLNQFSSQIFCYVFFFRFQPPSQSYTWVFYTLRVFIKISIAS